jgi:hypothetical protein
MYTEMALTARRFAVTLAVAGIAAMGSIAVAPVASAAEEAPVSIEDSNGPDAFAEREHGRLPIFMCDEDKPNKQHNKCLDLTGSSRF